MLFALVYSMLRLLLDLVDVRLRVHDPEAELLLLRLKGGKSRSGSSIPRRALP